MVCILLEDTGKFWLDISKSRVLVPFIITSCLEKRDTENVSALNTSTTDGKQSNQKLFPDVLMRPQGLGETLFSPRATYKWNLCCQPPSWDFKTACLCHNIFQ